MRFSNLCYVPKLLNLNFFCVVNDYCIQAINVSAGTLVAETLGDKIKVSQHDVWDITLSTKTGSIEAGR